MLRFITFAVYLRTRTAKFQYIPCYGLSRQIWVPVLILSYFNTSHVTVYPAHGTPLHSQDPFQYIPCYGLSFNSIMSAMQYYYFNTSHVTVYLPVSPRGCRDKEFQYIPCYGLSGLCNKITEALVWFQYIPCYGLSARTNSTTYQRTDFNTSHVTVYQNSLYTLNNH